MTYLKWGFIKSNIIFSWSCILHHALPDSRSWDEWIPTVVMGIHTVKLGAAVAGSQPVSAGAEDQRLHATIHRHCETTTLTLTNHFSAPSYGSLSDFSDAPVCKGSGAESGRPHHNRSLCELDGTRLERAKDSRKNKRARYWRPWKSDKGAYETRDMRFQGSWSVHEVLLAIFIAMMKMILSPNDSGRFMCYE